MTLNPALVRVIDLRDQLARRDNIIQRQACVIVQRDRQIVELEENLAECQRVVELFEEAAEMNDLV